MNYLANRAREGTTWAGVVVGVSQILTAVFPEQKVLIDQIAVAIAGILLAALPNKF